MKEPELNFEEAVFDDLTRGDLDYRSVPTSRKAFFLVLGVAAALILGVIGKVAFLVFAEGSFFSARASANITRETSIQPYRAVIVDRFGGALAENVGSFGVLLNMKSFIDAPDRLGGLFADLSEILGMDRAELDASALHADPEKDNWIVLSRGLESREAIAVKGLGHPALQVIDDYKREYVDAPVFAHVIGYTGLGEGNAVLGKSGLELQYDSFIRGEGGKYVFYEDAAGKILGQKAVSAPKPAEPFKTTIDAGLQKFFYRRLKSALDSLGRDSGAGIALDPRTGEVLALTSFPSFDSNVFIDRSRSKERLNLLTGESKPLFNRAISGAYSPGSTIKPLVAIGALHEGVVNPESEVYSSGRLEIPNQYNPESPSVFLDWKAHGWVDLRAAIARSSNIYFYLTGGGIPKSLGASGLTRGVFDASGLGIARLRQYWGKFGFNNITGIDLPSENSGLLPGPEEKEKRTNDPWRLGDTYNVSIGQGDFLVTPIQLINFIASVANGGKLYKPFLKKDSAPEILADYSDLDREIEEVKRGMEDGVSFAYGSSHLLSSLPFPVAGKTGTPQIENKAKTNAFFVGYAPADDPKIAILVLVENAREGSLNALPIAKDVFEWYYENRLKDL